MQDEAFVASGYDALYGAVSSCEPFQRRWRALACGDDFPIEYAHISFLTTAELETFVAHLALGPGGRLADLACGAGGPGLAVAARASCAVVGVDVSVAGLHAARARARRLARPSAVVAGSFTALPLRPGSVDAVMSVDALQYAPDKRAAIAEMARVLRPGGTLALTVFEVDPARAAGLPVLGTDPVADYRDLLVGAGLRVDSYEQTDRWHERVTSTYQGVLDERDAVEGELGAEAFRTLELELTMTLATEPYCGRALVLATASRRR